MEHILNRCPKVNGSGHDPELATASPEQTISERATAQQNGPLAAESGITIGGAIAQAKLAVGPSNDPYEREADVVAARVVRLLQSEASSPGLAETEVGPRVQRSSAVEATGDRAGGDTASRVRLADARPMSSGATSRISRVQRSAVVGAQGGDLDDDTARMLSGSRSGGAPLPEPARSKMEGAFGADFSGVRVHAGPTSTELNNRIQAKAFTTGSDIFFRDGVPDATTGSGQELLAHELTHTIQQGAAGQISRSTAPIQRDGVMYMDAGGAGHGAAFVDGATGVGEFIASPTTLAELAVSAEVSHQSWAESDAVLLAILRGPFEENWFKAKACLAMDTWPLPEGHARPSHDVGITLMQAMVDMRGRVWDAFVKEVQPLILTEVENHRQRSTDFADVLNPVDNAKGDGLGANFGLNEAVGSESVTSDIDLSAKGENTEIGLAMINREFRARYGTEPGALLDVNVYSSDWMFGGKQVESTGGEYKIKPTEEGGELSAVGQEKKDDQNEIWSMVKIRRNMDDSDWDTYKQTLVAGLGDGPDTEPQRAEMAKKFAVADAEYTTFRNDVATSVDEMEKGLDYETRQQQSAFADQGTDHLAHEANEMKASNRRYEEIVLRVKALRLRIKMLRTVEGLSPDDIEDELLFMHNEISRGLTYANEVYATQGAVLHTVYGKQGAKKKLEALQNEPAGAKKDAAEKLAGGMPIKSLKYDLTKEMFLQSLNENVGDTLHALKHDEADPPYAAYRAGKYINRLCDAATELIGEEAAENISGYEALSKLGAQSVKEKAGAAGKDPQAVHSDDSAFCSTILSDLADLKAATIKLGATAAAIYKKEKAQAEQGPGPA